MSLLKQLASAGLLVGALAVNGCESTDKFYPEKAIGLLLIGNAPYQNDPRKAASMELMGNAINSYQNAKASAPYQNPLPGRCR